MRLLTLAFMALTMTKSPEWIAAGAGWGWVEAQQGLGWTILLVAAGGKKGGECPAGPFSILSMCA